MKASRLNRCRRDTVVRPRFFNSLRFRVAAVILLVSMVPLGIVSVFAVRTARRVIISIVNNQLENLAAEKQDLLERWIAERRGDLAVVAGASVTRSMDATSIGPYLDLVQRQYGVYKRFVVAGADARIVYDTQGRTGSVRDEEWYRHLANEPTYMSEVSPDPRSEGSVFRIAQRVLDQQGKPAGAVCATVGTQPILARVLTVSLGQTGECYLVDRTGTFLAHKEPQRILKQNIAQSESFTNIFGRSGPRPIYTDYRGIAVLGASRAVTGTPWYVVVEQDRDEAFQSLYHMMHNIYLVIALTVFGAIGLSWVLASYVTSPVRALSEAAYAISRGDFAQAQTAHVARNDEIGALHTAFRHMADQLSDRHAQLQTRIGTTEAELQKAYEQLKGTLEAAARTEHLAALGRLAAGVAHEIRTPLTSLKLFLQSVGEEIAVSAEHGEDYRIAMQQVRRIETTINHFLDFARPSQPVLVELDFQKLLDEAMVVVMPRANQQEIEVRRSIATGLPKVEGDMRQLGEALVNLLVNALEAMPNKGRLTISIQTENAESAGTDHPWVRIDVSDTGPGIKPAHLSRLFEPFFTTKASGSGLGLAIVKGTVERHGGTITVRSEPDAGTTFSMRLPGKKRRAQDERWGCQPISEERVV